MATDKILQQVLVPATDHQTDLIKLLSRPELPNKLIAVLLLFRMIPSCFQSSNETYARWDMWSGQGAQPVENNRSIPPSTAPGGLPAVWRGDGSGPTELKRNNLFEYSQYQIVLSKLLFFSPCTEFILYSLPHPPN